ncbi:MAG: hypothetical protein HND44_03870 [Chloroflexi bacterium]|nr:hypothetical protein [Ardenticatenaceae bacterium]MBL1127637.1 hypothetical protein [Chloroflexota bacterium]NOG33702.1 hypothetical protein [Chloroflexota bacterium]GIK56023.1 MAG: hypothetical protein BroJett015_16860 [Chloroflexota bacterium]
MDEVAVSSGLLKQTLEAWEKQQPVPAVWQSFVAWPQLRGLSATELSLRLYDLCQEMVQQQLNGQRQVEGLPPITPPTTRPAALAVLVQEFSQNSEKLEGWSTLYHRHFSPVSLRPKEIETAVPHSRRNVDRRHRQGVDMLWELLYRQEMTAMGRTEMARLCRHLPPPDYAHLFGVETLLNRLLEWAVAAESLPFFSIEGIGGIGKTTIARAAAHQMAKRGGWADVLWVSARQYNLDVEHGRLQPTTRAAQTFADIALHLSEQLGQLHLAGLPAEVKLERLQPILKANPHLVIIDNLETLADVDMLIPRLEPLADPTRFLLTSRHTMSRYPYIHILPVPDLSLADSQRLIESELARRHKPPSLTPAQMATIYQTVGGLPLALKLIAAQLARRPYEQALSWLQQADLTDPYIFIYRHAWHSLSPPAQRLLVDIMEIGPDGENWEGLELLSGLEGVALGTAVDELIDVSLLETSHQQDALLYRLHRLTVTFLRADVLGGWKMW